MSKSLIHNLFSAVLLMAALQACNKEPLFSEKVEAVSISFADNALRIAVDITLKEPASWKVEYWPASDGEKAMRSTSSVDAVAGKSRSIVKFLYPETDYKLRVRLSDGRTSKIIDARTGRLPLDLPSYTVDEDDGKTRLDGYLMHWMAESPGYLTFCDFDGRVVWYQAYEGGVRTAVYQPETGLLALLVGFVNGDITNGARHARQMIVSDLDGNIRLRRNCNPDFLPLAHHELTFMPDGGYLAVQNFIHECDGIDVWHDGFSVIDRDGNILNQWDSSREIDPAKTDYVNYRRFSDDYLHANSVACDGNGDFYMTFNRITELWKIDGRTGEVLYRVGDHGDVAMERGTFKGGLHAATVLAPDRVLCYANGSNTGNSFAVIFDIDPETKTGRYDLRLPLPTYYSSENRSNVSFVSGDMLMFCSTVSGKVVFMRTDGEIVRVLSRSGISYRGYWFTPDEIK